MPRSATPPGAVGTRRSNHGRGLELTDQKAQTTVAQQFLQAAADGLTTGAVSALRKTLPAGLRPAASRSPRSKSKGRKEETVRRHSAHAASTKEAQTNTGGSASAFLFNACERSERRASSIIAATEAAVQAIATEILEAQDVAAVQRKAAPQSSQDLCQALAPRTEPPDPWASSSESDAESEASQKELASSATLSAPALQDQASASISTIRSRGSSSRQSAEPEG
ncbi:unnamed protein product, partial [Symbiodinium microadriaticum]